LAVGVLRESAHHTSPDTSDPFAADGEPNGGVVVRMFVVLGFVMAAVVPAAGDIIDLLTREGDPNFSPLREWSM